MYNTKQRQELLQYLQNNVGVQLSSTQIYQYFQGEGKKPIGLSTIYRYIDALLKEGHVRKYYIEGDNTAYYEYVDPDAGTISFQCDSCGKIEHIHCSDFGHTKEHMLKDHGILVNTKKTVFYGECSACNRKHV